MRRPATRIVAAILALGVGPQAGAHTATELDAWVADWEARSTIGVDAGSLAQLADMAERHPWYFNPVAEPAVTAADPAPATAPAPADRPPSAPASVEDWRELVAAYFAPGDVDRALCLMALESAGDPNAVNPSSGAAGLFQVMPFWWDAYGGDRFDPADNVAMAARILGEQGWTAWSPYKRGECR